MHTLEYAYYELVLEYEIRVLSGTRVVRARTCTAVFILTLCILCIQSTVGIPFVLMDRRWR